METTTDWITAISAAFAAVGTVGAVIIALWQTVGQSRSDIKARCFYRPTDGIFFLTADNPRQVPVNLLAAGLAVRGKVHTVGPRNFGLLPVKLGHKDSVTVTWSAEELREVEAEDGPIHYATFMSELDGAFRTAMPGGKKRHWSVRKRGTVEDEFEPSKRPPWSLQQPEKTEGTPS